MKTLSSYFGKELKPGVIPCGNRVVVMVAPTERVTAGGIVIPDDTADRMDMAQIKAVVVAIGPDCWAKSDEPWCEVGDLVLIAKYSGFWHKGPDKQDYRVINDRDVVAIVKE